MTDQRSHEDESAQMDRKDISGTIDVLSAPTEDLTRQKNCPQSPKFLSEKSEKNRFNLTGASICCDFPIWLRNLGLSLVAEEARELAARVSEGRFYVACVGQFKRGKSTLLNALVGHEVVPTGFVPVTAVPTVIRFGDEPHARVRMRDGVLAGRCHDRLEGIRDRRAKPRKQKGRGRRGSIRAQPFVVLRHVLCGYAGFGLGLHRKYGDHAGVHSSH
jgi:hypothetical protein